MITIINVSKGKSTGLQHYELRINEKLITTFTHKREDGLGRCLLEAAKAVEKFKWEQAAELLELLDQKQGLPVRVSKGNKHG